MNKHIEWYFEKVELKLLQSPIVFDYFIQSKDILYTEGKIRIKIKLKNNDLVELFEFVREKTGKIQTKKYSFHWQDEEGNLIKRWDNAPHHIELLNFPNHIHLPSDRVKSDYSSPNIINIISEIENALLKMN